MDKIYYVYMITNNYNNVLYTGITNNLERRVYEHQHGLVEGFTKKYKCNKLVYYEQYLDPKNAITREKEIKGWVREKKNMLIDKLNPQWIDLSKNEFQFPIDSSASPQNDTVIGDPSSLRSSG